VYGLEAVPPETFVGHRRVHRAHEGDLDAYVREGDDGSWQVLAFYDPERESACNDYSPRVVPPSRCIPEHVPWLELFGDALCTTRVYEAADDECVLDTPVAIMETRNTPDGCGGIDEYDLYEIAETRETPLYRAGANSSCEPRTSSGETVRGWVGGASIDPATLPALETIEVGNGAVRGAFLGISGVPFFPVSLGNGPFLEASSGESCRPEEFADGALRCVPGSFSRLGSIIYYADPTCTSTPLVRLEDDPCERVPIAGILIYEEGVECRASRIVESRALGPRTTAAIVYRFEATTQTCAPLQTSTDTTAGFYPFGDTLDADEVFPRVERIMRD
jgi:hypothetical protein